TPADTIASPRHPPRPAPPLTGLTFRAGPLVPDPRGPAVPTPLFLTRLLTRTGLARYLPGVQRLTDGGADFLHYYSDRVLGAPRAAGAFPAVLDAFVNPGDRVVLFDPTSPLFPLALRARRARVRWLASWVEDGRTHFRLDELDRALRRARLLVLAQPGNPGGGF